MLQRLCVGEGAGGSYYVTVWASEDSGDGRLHLGNGTLARARLRGRGRLRLRLTAPGQR